MKLFGWKSGRDASRPALARGVSAGVFGEWPRSYEAQVREGYAGNPVAQRAVKLVADGVGWAPVAASDPVLASLVGARSGGQALLETLAAQLLLHNEALVVLDAAVQPCAAGFGIDAPPADPVAGTCWIVGDDPTGAWIGHSAELAMWTVGGWRFVAPTPGYRVWVIDAGVDARFVDGAWTLGTIAAEHLVLAGIELLATPAGPIAEPIGGATIDLQARAAITAILAALRHHNLVETA